MAIYTNTLADISKRTVENLAALAIPPRTAIVTARLGALITLVVLVESDDPDAVKLRKQHAAAYKRLNDALVGDKLLNLVSRNATTSRNGTADPRTPLKRLRNSLSHFRVDPVQDDDAESTKGFLFEDGPDPRGGVWTPNWRARISASSLEKILVRLRDFLHRAKAAP